MENNRGWKAIIYNAPWARFAQGQSGVIISQDGKTCETTDDSKNSIIVTSDENTSYEPRENGYILFTQNDTGLYDIVCLYQNPAEHEYSLHVNDLALTCDNATWSNFQNSLSVYFLEDETNRIPCTNYTINYPTEQAFNTMAQSMVNTSFTISVSASYQSQEYTAQGTCNLTFESIKVARFTGYCENKITVEASNCQFAAHPTSIGCNDSHTITFTITSSKIYTVDLNGFVECEVCDKICGNDDLKNCQPGTIEYCEPQGEGVNIVERGNDYIKFTVANEGASAIEFKAKSTGASNIGTFECSLPQS